MSGDREQRSGIWGYFDDVDDELMIALTGAVPPAAEPTDYPGRAVVEPWLFDQLPNNAPNSVAAFLATYYPNNPETLEKAYKFLVELLNGELQSRQGRVSPFERFFLAILRRIPGVTSTDPNRRQTILKTNVAEKLLPLILAHIPMSSPPLTQDKLMNFRASARIFLAQFHQYNYDDLSFLDAALYTNEFTHSLSADIFLNILRGV
jgi:hypothetical protein